MKSPTIVLTVMACIIARAVSCGSYAFNNNIVYPDTVGVLRLISY